MFDIFTAKSAELGQECIYTHFWLRFFSCFNGGKLYIIFVLWVWAHVRRIRRQLSVFCSHTTPRFSLCLAKLGYKMKKTIKAVISERCKDQHVWCYRTASVPTEWVTWIQYVWRYHQHRGTCWAFRERQTSFPEMSGDISAVVRRYRGCVPVWPACSSAMPTIENILHIIKRRITL